MDAGSGRPAGGIALTSNPGSAAGAIESPISDNLKPIQLFSLDLSDVEALQLSRHLETMPDVTRVAIFKEASGWRFVLHRRHVEPLDQFSFSREQLTIHAPGLTVEQAVRLGERLEDLPGISHVDFTQEPGGWRFDLKPAEASSEKSPASMQRLQTWDTPKPAPGPARVWESPKPAAERSGEREPRQAVEPAAPQSSSANIEPAARTPAADQRRAEVKPTGTAPAEAEKSPAAVEKQIPADPSATSVRPPGPATEPKPVPQRTEPARPQKPGWERPARPESAGKTTVLPANLPAPEPLEAPPAWLVDTPTKPRPPAQPASSTPSPAPQTRPAAARPPAPAPPQTGRGRSRPVFLAVYPFVRMDLLDQFLEALAQHPAVQSVEMRGLFRSRLELNLRLRGDSSTEILVEAFAGVPHRLTSSKPDSLEIELL